MPVDFKPTSYSELLSDIQLLKTKTSEIKTTEEALGINDSLDGIPGRSRLEDALYSNLVIRDSKKAAEDGIYYFVRNQALNPKGYQFQAALNKLINSAQKYYAVTEEEIGSITTKAYLDHLLANDANAQQLIRDLGQQRGEEYVMAIAQCWYNPCIDCRQKVLDLAKALVPSNPPFPIGTFNALRNLCDQPLSDKPLFLALVKIQDEYNAGRDFRNVRLVASN